jgi:Subtilase family
LPPGFDRRIVDIPPPNETRLKTDEVMVQIRIDIGLDRLRAAVAPLGVSILASEDLSILGSTAVRLHIDNGRSPAEVIRALAAVQFLAAIQPQYVYHFDQAASAPAPAASNAGQAGDAAQYILEKLSLADVHRMVRGTNVPIAVIDSEIDATHPDLEGVVAQRYDAVGAQDKPHPHGTGMAGAIGAHQRLLGTAPAARLLAVHAFSTSAATAESTTFNILKGVNWAVNQGVRVINMSFAGPKDPSLERALKMAYDKNIVLIAAAGNAGPKSPPLYPGADPNVIAVTATDVEDKLFAGANRGKYISVSAPGVDILVPAPERTYQLTTGTSVAAAEVSGGTQPQAHARGHPPCPAIERQASRARRARRQFRLRSHRSAQGAATRRSAYRGRAPATETHAAVRMSTSRDNLLDPRPRRKPGYGNSL